jgi:putative SOS response-associated peptidase YedK
VLAIRQPRELVALKGLIPSWTKDKKIVYSTNNARSDSVTTKPAFRSAYKSQRRLVLADGYYEGHTEVKLKQPTLFEIDGGKPFAFAGLWERWHDPAQPNAPPVETARSSRLTPMRWPARSTTGCGSAGCQAQSLPGH